MYRVSPKKKLILLVLFGYNYTLERARKKGRKVGCVSKNSGNSVSNRHKMIQFDLLEAQKIGSKPYLKNLGKMEKILLHGTVFFGSFYFSLLYTITDSAKYFCPPPKIAQNAIFLEMVPPSIFCLSSLNYDVL